MRETGHFSREPQGEKADLEYAEKVLGRDVIGPRQVSEQLDIEIPEQDVPPLPFSKRDLDIAKKNGLVLIYRIQHDRDGLPLTASKLAEMVKKHVPKREQAYYGGTFSSERQYYNDSVKKNWALVSREPILKARYQKLPEQARQYVEKIFEGDPPTELKEAIVDFDQQPDQQKDEIWEYRLSQLTLPRFLDAYYDKIMIMIGTGYDSSTEAGAATITPENRGILETYNWEDASDASIDYHDTQARFTWAPSEKKS